MNYLNWVIPIALIFIVGRWGAQLWLAALNQRNVLAHADSVPDAFKDSVDAATYEKSVQYTLAKSNFGRIEMTWDVLVLSAAIFSGALPWGYRLFTGWLGNSAWSMAAYLFTLGVVLSLTGTPFEWYAQFRLEERFGFNTATLKLWLLDRVKALLLTVALGYPLLVLILKLVEWTGALWWLWAWACMLVFQLLMVVLAPILILPLFNKFTPLPEGVLRERLLALGRRTDFAARDIQVMDGSKAFPALERLLHRLRSLPRKIVLFTTRSSSNSPNLNWRPWWRTRSATTRNGTSPRCSRGRP